MGRREARIARKYEKQIKENEKKARLVETVALQHQPRASFDPDDTKKARAEATPESIMQLPMAFRMFDFADRDEQWSWGQLRNWCSPEAKGGAGCVIRVALNDMSRLTWSEILSQTTGGRERHRKHHGQSWDSLCQEAQERWLWLERTEEDLFRFRVGGKERIWGVRQGATFFVVWWDAEHQIYPTEKG
jgi:hypothetical protein